MGEVVLVVRQAVVDSMTVRPPGRAAAIAAVGALAALELAPLLVVAPRVPAQPLGEQPPRYGPARRRMAVPRRPGGASR